MKCRTHQLNTSTARACCYVQRKQTLGSSLLCPVASCRHRKVKLEAMRCRSFTTSALHPALSHLHWPFNMYKRALLMVTTFMIRLRPLVLSSSYSNEYATSPDASCSERESSKSTESVLSCKAANWSLTTQLLNDCSSAAVWVRCSPCLGCIAVK
jgi:hypothetical protein